MMRPSRLKVAEIGCHALLLAFCFCALDQTCRGQQQLVSPSTPSAQWTAGPVKINIAGIAEINVPEGFQFSDQKGASSVLGAANNPIPETLVGILAPVSGKWYAVLQFANIGYVRDAGPDRLDDAAILQAVQADVVRQIQALANNNGMPVDARVNWELKPTYDPTAKQLEWAFRLEGQSQSSVNYTISLLGRRGVLGVVVVRPTADSLDLASIREIVKGITFLEHERYADYVSGDKLANFDLAGLITTRELNVGWKQYKWPAVAGGGAVGLILLLALSIRAVKRLKAQHARATALQSIVPLSPAPSAAAAQNGHHPQVAPAAPAALVANGKLPPLPAMAGNGAHRNGKKSRQSDRKRRKFFRYQNFYSDMVMSLTRCNYVGAFGSFEGENDEESNGSVLPYRKPSAPTASQQATQDTNKTLMSETSRLIESQQKLIEGQRRLIEEQTKLIEEKSKLIDVENRVLEKQSELFAEQQLL